MYGKEFRIIEVPVSQAPVGLLLTADPSIDQLMQYLPGCRCFTGQAGAEIYGVIAVEPIGGNRLEIKNLAVAEQHQKKGYARQLINYVISLAASSGYKILVVKTCHTSLPALQLYQKAGFRITRKEENYFISHYPEPIYEHGRRCLHRLTLELPL